MFLLDGTWCTSASDLTTASKCEFAFLRKLDAKLGRIEAVPDAEDAMLARTGVLGDKHERPGARRLPRAASATASSRSRVHDRALDRDPAVRGRCHALGLRIRRRCGLPGHLLRRRAFLGFADFIVRTAGGALPGAGHQARPPRRVTALLQLAAYADQLSARGARADTVELLLGDGTRACTGSTTSLPVYRKRRARLLQIVRRARGRRRRGRVGRPALHRLRPLRDVRRPRSTRAATCCWSPACACTQRDALRRGRHHHDRRAGGQSTARRIAGIADAHARGAPRPGAPAGGRRREPHGDAIPPRPIGLADLACRRRRSPPLPEPDPGDIFFDFEGDPLYTEGAGASWGIDYLFGVRRHRRRLHAVLGAHLRRGAGRARSLPRLRRRAPAAPPRHAHLPLRQLRAHPPALHRRPPRRRRGTRRRAAARRRARRPLPDRASAALRVGGRSYSIKKLEPLYMGDELREGVHQRRRLDRGVRSARETRRGRRARRGAGASSTTSPTTTATTACPPCACATGCSTVPPRAECSGSPCASRGRAVRAVRARHRPVAPGRRR